MQNNLLSLEIRSSIVSWGENEDVSYNIRGFLLCDPNSGNVDCSSGKAGLKK